LLETQLLRLEKQKGSTERKRDKIVKLLVERSDINADFKRWFWTEGAVVDSHECGRCSREAVGEPQRRQGQFEGYSWPNGALLGSHRRNEEVVKLLMGSGVNAASAAEGGRKRS